MGNSEEASAKRKQRRWPIIVGVVAIVVVAAGAGFLVWHEQPGFCNAVCHDPMDSYVEGYHNDETLMAYTHARENVTCLQCHEPRMDEQIAEGIAWVTGDFGTDDAGKIVRTGVTADEKMCTQNGCHDFSEVRAATADWGGETGVNPHDSHQGIALDCSNCHGAHGQSYMYCNTCHDYEVPGGWADPGIRGV
ncbi:cytochrome c3 family protein [Raoultibacter phocaeensis]|uniref:cytochrome c3 family protein n=1 Tax=Raoultibacter phocaeensis TaxID=2479841 RepID=UPI00111AC5BE|nr:cytochrome c3 family protein [Raoultibacter phocaeensis]